MNRNFLKEAIADAKAVKESAIANAKVALEEAFSPQVQAMFASKIEEMENEEVKEEVEEVTEASNDDKEEINEKMPNPVMRHGEDEDGEPEEGALKATEHDREITEEDNKEIDEVLSELEEDEKTDAEEEGYLDGEEDEAEDLEDEDDEDIDLDDLSEEDLKSFIEDVIEDMVNAGELEAGESFGDEEEVDDVEVEDDVDVDVEDDVDVEIAEDQGYDDRLDDAEGGRHGKKKQDMKQRRADSENMEKAKGKRKFAGDKEMDKVKEELAEAYATVGTLRTELNEINLLNAKLLYTNKVFRGKNLNENQKVKVLKAFDKAETIKEVKLVFETIDGSVKSKVSNKSISEGFRSKGSASNLTANPKASKKQPIVESDEMVKRFQKLAGIL